MIIITFCVILCAISANGQNKTSLKCGKNEVENSCPKYGTIDVDCETLLSGFKKNCPPAPDNYQCTPRCDCKKDFVRIGTDCVSADQCCTGKNEEIVDCPADADDTCTGKLPGTQLIPCFNKGCHCKKNFVRHEGSCITRKDCPDKDDTPKYVNPLQCIGGKAKKAVADALKKAGKAKVVVSKNFMKRANGTDSDPTIPAMPKVVLPILNLTSTLTGLAAKIGLGGKPTPVDPSSDKPCGDPINPLEALRSEIAARLAQRT